MLNLSDSHHFRKTVAGVCMVASPLVLLVGMVIHPERTTDEGAQLAVIADNLDAWFLAHLLVLIAIALALPATLGLMHMLRERQVAWGHVGGGLALLGLLATTGIVAIEGFVGWQAAQGGADQAQMTALFERVFESTGVLVPFFFMSFALALGFLILAMGLYRARAVQSWTAGIVAIGAILLTLGGPTASAVLNILGAAFLLVGLGTVGLMVLGETDEEWEHTPEYRGFRPLAGAR